jgi:RNA polymerase sigma factor (sigma-70 family)
VSDSFRTVASDEELVAAFQADRTQTAVDALLRRHEGLVISVARNYFVPGGDDEDVRQQAMIGFWKAVRDYVPGAGTAFTSFARTCMQRQVITAVKAANRHKHAPLTDSQRIVAHDTDDRDSADDGPASPVVPTAGHEDVAVWRLDSGGAGALPFGVADIEHLLAEIEQGHDIAVGRRHDRQDKLISRKIPSKIANWLIGKVTGVPIKDNGCSLKAFRADLITLVEAANRADDGVIVCDWEYLVAVITTSAH